MARGAASAAALEPDQLYTSSAVDYECATEFLTSTCSVKFTLYLSCLTKKVLSTEKRQCSLILLGNQRKEMKRERERESKSLERHTHKMCLNF